MHAHSPLDLPVLSNDDVLDMECLSSVERIGDPPDRCDAGHYARLGLIVKADRYWILTTEGRERLADLRVAAAECADFLSGLEMGAGAGGYSPGLAGASRKV
jgi:hypothetical protein